MKERRLRHRRQRLVRALHDNIRAAAHRALREIRVKAEVRAVSFVHDEGGTVGVGKCRPAPNILHAAFISGAGDDGRVEMQSGAGRYRVLIVRAQILRIKHVRI